MTRRSCDSSWRQVEFRCPLCAHRWKNVLTDKERWVLLLVPANGWRATALTFLALMQPQLPGLAVEQIDQDRQFVGIARRFLFLLSKASQ